VASGILNAVMALNPVMIVVAALFALIGVLVAAYFRFESVRNIVDAVWQKIYAWAMWLWEYLAPALAAIWDAIVATFKAVLTFFQEDFIPLVTATAEILTAIWQAFADFFTEYVWPIVKAAFEGITSVIDNFWDVIKAMVNLVKALFSGDFKEVWFALRTLVGEVIDLIVDYFIFLPGRIWNAARPLIGKFALIVSDFTVYLFQKILNLIQSIPDQIVEFISGIASDILSIGKDIGSWIIDGLVNAIKAAAGAVMDAVKSIIPDVGGMVSGAIGKVGGWLGLAEGGIVNSPTLALIGEAGPEAVVPLDKAYGAAALGGMGTTFNITVNAGMGTDGRQVGNQIVSALKQWERTNGSLPLSVSAV
jgi:phage-related protein